MQLFALEHGRAGYWADFAAYGLAILLLAGALGFYGPPDERTLLFALAALGFAGWTLIEYAMHRFVLHGLEPFRSWHARHHDRPTALISAPTVLSATLIIALVYLPALVAAGNWPACALTLGITAGYLAYAITHHATHHWRAEHPWLKERKRWHALHHHAATPGHYGVSSSFWDRVFGSVGGPAAKALSSER